MNDMSLPLGKIGATVVAATMAGLFVVVGRRFDQPIREGAIVGIKESRDEANGLAAAAFDCDEHELVEVLPRVRPELLPPAIAPEVDATLELDDSEVGEGYGAICSICFERVASCGCADGGRE
jgi:hypothetical protein